jgi:hypothetical protein
MAELSPAETSADPCCTPARQAACCEPSAKAKCCGRKQGCGCAAERDATDVGAGESRSPSDN